MHRSAVRVGTLMISRSQSHRYWCPEGGYTVKRVNAIFSLCYALCRVSLKRISTISFFKHVIIWKVDFYELTYCFQLRVNCLFFFVFSLLSGFLVQWLSINLRLLMVRVHQPLLILSSYSAESHHNLFIFFITVIAYILIHSIFYNIIY